MSALNSAYDNPAVGGAAGIPMDNFNIFLLALDLFGGRRD